MYHIVSQHLQRQIMKTVYYNFVIHRTLQDLFLDCDTYVLHYYIILN